jgi:hypothetical protein
MDVQAELANAIKARHNKVYGIETPPPAPEKTKQKNTRQPVTTNGIGKSSKNKAQKAAAAAIAAKMGGKPAQSKPEKKEKKGWKAPFSKKGSSGGTTSSRPSLSEKDKQTVEEYRKMLKRGLPEGAVLHKMQSLGVSKHIIDAVMSKDEAPSAVVNNQTQSSGSLSQEEEKIAEQYRKMKKMGLPDGAVTHKMIADGVSVKIQEAVLAGNSAPTATSSSIATSSSSSRNSGTNTNTNAGGKISSLSRNDEATATPYRKMIKTGLPEGAVRHKMTMNGVEMHIQDSVLKGETAGNSANTATTNVAATSNAGGKISSLSRKDEATATPYRKMIKTGLPEGAVRHKMTMDGIEMHIQDSVLNGETAGNSANTAANTNVAATSNAGGKISSLSRKDEATATPYRKMIKTGLPEGAVRHKMTMDGIEMHIQDSVLNGKTAGNSANTAANTNVAATSNAGGKISSLSRKDEATATPYRKMIKTGLPEGAVRHKMTMDGVEKHIQDSVLKGETAGNSANTAANTNVAATTSNAGRKFSSLSRQDEATATPYRKMIKTGLPEGAVIHKMTMDGVEKHIQDSVLKGETPAPADDPSSGDTSNTRPVNPMAAAITSSGGIGFLKKATPTETDSQPSKPSNPLTAAIAASGGQRGLKKASVDNNQQSPKPRSSGNSLVDELAAKGFRSGLKKTPPKAQKQPPKASSGYNNLTEEISAKGFNSSFNSAVSAKQPPKPKSANVAVSSKQKPVYVPPKPQSASVAVSSKQKPAVNVPPKPKSASIAVRKPVPTPVAKPSIQKKVDTPKPKPANIAVSSKQKPAVYVPPKLKSASVPTPVAKPNKQKKVDTQISPEMSMNNNKQPRTVAINRSEDNGNTQNEQKKKKVKNSSKKKKTSVNDDGAEQHCQCIVM